MQKATCTALVVTSLCLALMSGALAEGVELGLGGVLGGGCER